MEINKIYNENCLDTMAKMPDNFIDLTVTSPPYDNLREYKGYSFAFEEIAKELFRITNQGGVVVWGVGDATMNGSESGTSFKQALFFKEIGFNLHDTMNYQKINYVPLTHNRYEQSFEFMFILSKGRPLVFNPIKDKENKWYGTKCHGQSRGVDGKTFIKSNHNKTEVNRYGKRHNVWSMSGEKNNETSHPAVFPESLANDHIISWSNKDDIVLDPFMGSGTTGKMAYQNNRNYIGFEISKEYCDIANKRIEDVKAQIRMEL